ncbi:MAG: hypothetical protein QW727_03010 [Candidatus Pacearchaeota archaeon]
MSYTLPIGYEKEINTSKYLKCLAEGMKDWIEVKVIAGNKDIQTYKNELEKEIKPSKSLVKDILTKMKSIGIKKDILMEFRETFKH